MDSRNEKFMSRCIELASKGKGLVAPNPMVGCVIVHEDNIIGEGYHFEFGGNHAEVNAINSIKDKSLLEASTLFVNLEPCNHKGKTPPCTNLIIKSKIPKVVVGAIDDNELVSGKGVEKLRKAGIEVTTNVLKKDCLELNKRFYTFHNKKRPFYILKWAESLDGFISKPIEKNLPPKNNWITNNRSKLFVHQLRAEESGILIGKKTAILDNPSLTVREVEGKNPVRIIICNSLSGRFKQLDLFTDEEPILVFNKEKEEVDGKIEYIAIAQEGLIPTLNHELYTRGIQSVIIEGGAETLSSFIHENCWDEALKLVGNKIFEKGIRGPFFSFNPYEVEDLEGDKVYKYKNYFSE